MEWDETDTRIFVKRVIIHKGVGMMLIFKSFEISLVEEDAAPKSRGRKKRQTAPLRMFFGDLMTLIKMDSTRIIDLVRNRMELVEGGRLKLDMEDWDFGDGVVNNWKLEEGE